MPRSASIGTTAITAITAQNTVTVTDVLPLPPRLVVAQIDAVVDDLAAIHAVKIGMLATADDRHRGRRRRSRATACRTSSSTP